MTVRRLEKPVTPGNPANLLVLVPDGHRGQDLGAAGNREIRTPNIDALAGQGVRFSHAYANTTVCTPSRGSMLTGVMPLRHRAVANDLSIRTDIPTIATELRDAGYATGYIGKWHLDGVPRTRFTPPGSRRLGFDALWEAWNCQETAFGARYYRDSDPAVRRYEDYAPFAQAGSATRFMAAHSREPFALFVSWTPPNVQCENVLATYRSRYDRSRLTLRPNVRGPEPGSPEDTSIGPTAPVTDAIIRETLACHYASITAVDEAVGRILRSLERLGLADRTVVVYTSDHGRPVWSHGYNRSELPWEESALVPLVIRAPDKLPAGMVSPVMTGLVDLTPTLLELLGRPPPPDLDGGSWMTN